MRRFRNPRYAPESLERRLSPSGLASPLAAEFATLDTPGHPVPGDPEPDYPSPPIPPDGSGEPPIDDPSIPSGPGEPALATY